MLERYSAPMDPLDDFGTPGVKPNGGFREGPRSEHLRPEFQPQRIMIDPFDIADIMRAYAPTRGDPRRGNIDNEIDFNWKRFETYGRKDFAEQRAYHDQGWCEVLHESFPGRFAPPGAKGPVIVKDMILMERPMRLTVEARNEEILAANRAMRVNQTNMALTPEGQAPRMVITDRTTREPIPIPDE